MKHSHYFGITFDGEIITRGIETRKHDTPNFIKQFQYDLLHILFSDRKDSSEVTTKGYEDALLLVTQTIDKIMTGERIEQRDLVISKLLRNGVGNYKSIFPHVAAAIQLRQPRQDSYQRREYPVCLYRFKTQESALQSSSGY